MLHVENVNMCLTLLYLVMGRIVSVGPKVILVWLLKWMEDNHTLTHCSLFALI
jgi:hypothetical protein